MEAIALCFLLQNLLHAPRQTDPVTGHEQTYTSEGRHTRQSNGCVRSVIPPGPNFGEHSPSIRSIELLSGTVDSYDRCWASSAARKGK
jgi:hypothetical protein